jgi:hypothetical protein
MTDTIATPSPEIPQPAPASPAVDMELRSGTDPEDIALQEAIAQVAAEEAAQAGIIADPEEPTKPQVAPVEQPKATPQMVPIERLNAVIADRDKHRDTANYLAGQVAAIQAGLAPATAQPDPAAAPQAPQPPATVAEARKQIREGRLAVQQAYDNAEINSTEYAEKLAALDDLLLDTVEAIAASAKSAPQTSLVDDAIQTQHSQTLEQAHPYLTVLTAPQLQTLADMTRARWNGEGKFAQFGNNKVKMDMAFRADMAALSDTLGPQWAPDFKPQPAAPAVPKPGAKPLSPTAAARAAKLDLAATMAPDISTIGKPGATNELTEEDIMKMSPIELERVSPKLLQRFLQ